MTFTPTPPLEPVTPDLADAAARDVCRRHARSFYFASHFLPREKRRHAYAVYAFCRLLDDAADEASFAGPAIDAMETTLGRVYDRRPPFSLDEGHDRAMHAFARTVHACGIPRRLFDDLIAGVRMDHPPAGRPVRIADRDELLTYCYHVAGVVGLIMTHVFTLADRSAEPAAVAMGNAMQLTNILRDVREDAVNGRVYLPADRMAVYGVEAGGVARLADGRPTGDWRGLAREVVADARDRYRQGMAGLAALPRDGSRQTAAVMGHVYAGILDEIEKADYDVFSTRRRLTLLGKVRRLPAAWRAWRSG